jgi:integrase/recombinase XerC
MTVRVAGTGQGHRLVGEGGTVVAANAFLGHLGARGYSPATVRAYAFDVANFATFLEARGLALGEVVPSDLFAYLDWQQEQQPRPRRAGGRVVALTRTGPAPATMNRRISAVRGLFEHQVMTGVLAENPVPAARRANGLRTPPRGMLGHVAIPSNRRDLLLRVVSCLMLAGARGSLDQGGGVHVTPPGAGGRPAGTGPARSRSG